MTLFTVARFPLSIVGQDYPSHMLCTMIILLVTCRVAPMVRLILTKSYTPATLKHRPAEDITAAGETSCLFIVNQSYRITSARRLKCARLLTRLAGALLARSKILLSFLTPACGSFALLVLLAPFKVSPVHQSH